jgi:hypothetical protein
MAIACIFHKKQGHMCLLLFLEGGQVVVSHFFFLLRALQCKNEDDYGFSTKAVFNIIIW